MSSDVTTSLPPTLGHSAPGLRTSHDGTLPTYKNNLFYHWTIGNMGRSFFFFKIYFIYLFETGAEGEGKANSLLSREPDEGLNPGTLGS